MPCLNLSNGNFGGLGWQTGNFNAGNLTITRTASAISVTRVGFTPLNMNGDFRWVVFGADQFVAILAIDPGGTRTVFILDATGATLSLEQIHLQTGVSSAVAQPSIAASPGTRSLFFVFSSTGTVSEVNALSIVRSDNGLLVLNRLGPVSGLTAVPFAEITSTELIIHHPNTFTGATTKAPRPAGNLIVTGPSTPFGEAVIGASNPALGTVTRTFTLQNTGGDCLDVTGIADSAPFALTAASRAQLPITLEPGGSATVSVAFTPTAVGTFNRTLAVTRTPPNGASAISCSGTARLAVASIATSLGAVNFGTLPHPSTATRTFTVSNSGDLDVTVGIAAAPAGSAFTWTTAMAQALPVGGVPITVSVDFASQGDFASATQIINVVPNQGASRQVPVNGAGCIANAAIAVPVIAPLDFGTIEQGFRTVRFIEVSNTGDGDLAFRARIVAGANPGQAANFGLVLPDNDITDAPAQRTYGVLPAARCGPGATGSNVVQVAVGFLAGAPSGAFGANLMIDQHNDPSIPAGQSWTFPLTANVIDPVPIDVALVIDKSGSMGNAIGTRNKMEAARAAARLFVEMLRDTADDRAAVVAFDTSPVVLQGMLGVAGNRPAFTAATSPANLSAGGATNIAGGVILGKNEFGPHPASPPVLKRSMIVLTDGIENRAFQDGGAAWFSITGRDANDPPEGMRRPDGTQQNTDPLPVPAGIRVFGVALGRPEQVDGAALSALSSATGAPFAGVTDLTGKDFFLLEKHFTQIFMDSVGLAQIADPFFTIGPGDEHRFEFDVFPADVNAMVVLYDEPNKRLPFYILSPRGELLSGSALPPGFSVRYRSTETARFVEFFFPNREPDRYAGRWTVVVKHPGQVCAGLVSGGTKEERQNQDAGEGFTPRKCRASRQPVDYGIAIAAGSNLRMQAYVDPTQKFVGDPIALIADLFEAGLPVRGATVKVRVLTPASHQYSVTLRDDGASHDGSADDGQYGGDFTNTAVAGEYRFLFRAEGVQAGKVPINWVREAERTKSVYEKRRPGDCDDKTPEQDDYRKRLLRLLEVQGAILRRLDKGIESEAESPTKS